MVLAADEKAAPPRTFLVSDGQPVERREFYTELARLLGVEAPEFVSPPADDPAAIRSGTDKRVDNARMVRELAVRSITPRIARA